MTVEALKNLLNASKELTSDQPTSTIPALFLSLDQLEEQTKKLFQRSIHEPEGPEGYFSFQQV